MNKYDSNKPIQEITSINNPKIKLWSQLLTKRGREAQGKFILEGIHLVREALQADLKLEVILFSLEKGYPDELSLAGDLFIEIIGVSDAVLAKCSDTQTPQGVLAVALKPEWSKERLLEQENGLVIVIDGVQDPGNLGTIIRSADAVGATGVVLGKGTVDLYNPKTIRSTMGSLFHLPILEFDLLDLLPLARDKNIEIVGTSLQADQSCYELDMTQTIWFILGNEGSGVSASIQPYISQQVIIPMRGKAESLNVAMAGTVLLFEAGRQRGLHK
ncbi:RNA methyltransferase [Paenibacillus psychroresistens]|uniref:RNA methyltransferase n=1 Tax=Paenibacillus psychroresistens TaxID=1778678 RepID=A0A6B8RGY8_9BACL|nr:RNA methyltransferase [Paenibacillus psychroresistens]QGQ94646.1 RNA methyltransferase [Paenibacillus psychroresistens]